MRIAALSGGIGGAKLVHGLAMALGDRADGLTAIVNTGDDWEWNGLLICPDADTVVYTLAGLANPQTGWGLAGDTFHCLEGLAALGRADWFHIGDRDLATHLTRTAALRAGAPLSQVAADLARRLGVAAHIVPSTDEPVRTRVTTAAGELEFQDYFVRRGARDAVQAVRYAGAESARPSPGALEALAAADLVVVCPSNPILSIGPILAVPGLRDALAARAADPRTSVVAVSPLVGGRAVKGPTVEVMRGVGAPATAAGVADLYRGLLDGFVLDATDAAEAPALRDRGLRVLVTDTLMSDELARARLAREVMAWASGQSSR
jgi:LPPG:FO 2-phospho-L-lactate transferase